MQASNHTVAGTSRPDKTKEKPRDAVLKACVRVALALFRSDKSVASLVKLAKLVSDGPSSTDHRTCKEANQLLARVTTFIGKLGHDFVKLVPSTKMECDADFEPHDWSKSGKPWHPKDAGVMYLNEVAIQSMIATKDLAHQKPYSYLLFDMGHAIARELACCFFAFIAASSDPIPHDVGGHWEALTFDGAIMDHNEVGVSQAGTLWLMKNGKIQQIQIPDLAEGIPHKFKLPLTLCSLPTEMDAKKWKALKGKK